MVEKRDTEVSLVRWTGPSPRDGKPSDRYSLEWAEEQKTLITRESEQECRAYAAEMGWVVRGE